MADGTAQFIAKLKKWMARVDRLLSGTWLESASVTNGRLRFIGGLLLIDSGGTLTVIGHLNGSGDFVWDGPWALKGAGEITGNVDITGNLELLDNGQFKSLGVSIRDGKIYVGEGVNQIVIDGATGKIHAGGMTIDPNESGGAVVFETGQLEADGDNGGARLVRGDAVVNVGDVASIRKGDASVIVGPLGVTVNAAAGTPIRLQGDVVFSLGDIATEVRPDVEPGTLRITSTGRLLRSVVE